MTMSYWVKTYGPGEGKRVVLDKNGDIIIAGYVDEGERRNGFVARFDKEGNVKWFKTYKSQFEFMTFSDMKIAPNGDIIVAGYVTSRETPGFPVMLRLDSTGNLKWSKGYNLNLDVSTPIEAIENDNNGDIIVVGHLFTMELNGNGDIKWLRVYPVEEDEIGYWPRAVKLALDGDIIIVGTTDIDVSVNDVYGEHIWIQRLNKDGKIKWQKTIIGGECEDYAKAIALAPNGDLIIAGTTGNFDETCDDSAWILRLDKTGNIRWQRFYKANTASGAHEVAIVKNGDILIAGASYRLGTNGGDAWVLTLDEDGNVKWQKIYGGKDVDYANSVAITPSGEVVITGKTKSFGTGIGDVWVLRLPANGELEGFSESPEGVVKDSKAMVSEVDIKTIDTSGVKVEELPVEVHQISIDPKIVYDSNNPRLIQAWRLISEGKLGEAAEILESLPPKLLGGFIKEFVKTEVLLCEGEEDKETAEVGIIVSNPHLNKLSGSVVLRNDEKFKPEKEVLNFKLRKGENYTELVRVTRAKNERYWDGLNAVFEFPEHNISITQSFIRKSKSGILYEMAKLEQDPTKKIELLREAELSGSYYSTRVLNEFRDSVYNSLAISIPELIDGIESTVRLSLKNSRFESLKVILYPKSDNIEFETTPIEFPEIKKGQEATKLVRVKPKHFKPWDYHATLDFRVKMIVNGVDIGEIEGFREVVIKENPSRNLSNVLDIQTKPLTVGIPANLSVRVKNTISDSLHLTLSLKGDSLGLKTTTIELPELKRGEEAVRSIEVIPQKTEQTSIRIKMEGTADGIQVEDIKRIFLDVRENPVKKELPKIVNIVIPDLIEETPAFIKVSVENKIADSLKIALDLSENGEFMEIDGIYLEFPELKRGQRISKSVPVVPMYAGTFDFKVRIVAVAEGVQTEATRTIPVEISERTAPVYFPQETWGTPSPASPQVYPSSNTTSTMTHAHTKAINTATVSAEEEERELYRGEVRFKMGALSQERVGTLVITNEKLILTGKYRIRNSNIFSAPVKAALRATGVGEVHEEIYIEAIRFLQLKKPLLGGYYIEFTVRDKKYTIYTDAAQHIYNLLKQYGAGTL